MKKLSIAIVLVTASVTFANAQTTDETAKVKTETVLENQVKVDTTVATPVAKEAEASMEAAKTEETATEVKKESPAEMKQKARMEKKAAKKLVE